MRRSKAALLVTIGAIIHNGVVARSSRSKKDDERRLDYNGKSEDLNRCTNSSSSMWRKLQQDEDFVPLSCNDNMGPCQNWTSVIGTNSSIADKVTIDCGVCITMDHPGPQLALQNGLDIQGKLAFPDGYSLVMETSWIVVQGELDMAATKAVDGNPSLEVVMTGSNTNQTFTPIGENANSCILEDPSGGACLIGPKAIVIAGGKVNVHGLPTSTPTWVKLYDALGGTFNNPTKIVVSNSTQGKWLAGAEVVITSHTRIWNEHQVRSITNVANSSGTPGYLELTLNSSILRPTTEVESVDFAVEVALLSRNIVFQSTTADPWDGGHLMVMRTPGVVQTIEGVEFIGFGQQGILGRYPIHFHFCGMVGTSLVARNTIRQSNQRCIVVHGTFDLRIEGNVAYDTLGHCYILEDGMETGNEFVGNLGAQTGIPSVLIPDQVETDDEPATFWITNPSNTFLNNVAAGSASSGYWFAPDLRGPRADQYPGLDPMNEPLTEFQNNIAHSNTGTAGAIRTYRPGYMPEALATFQGVKSFRNNNVGVVFHKCHNIILRDSLFADNNVQVDIDRAEGIQLLDTQIIGESDSYRQLMVRQPSVQDVCRNHRMYGLDLHTWKLHKEYGGVTVKNVSFSGFDNNVQCPTYHSIYMDNLNLRQGQFELFTTFENVSLADGVERISFCKAEENSIDTIYLIDLDGSLGPPLVTPNGVSVLLGSAPEMMQFVNQTKCTDVPSGCYKYCEDVCFRSVRYELDGSGTEDYLLKVCKSADPMDCTLFQGSQRGVNDPRTFIAHLPTGSSYKGVFLDGSGNELLPVYDVEWFEEDLCLGDTFSFTLVGGISSTPTMSPSLMPTHVPSSPPSMDPSSMPSNLPSLMPTHLPSSPPSIDSSSMPSNLPSLMPSSVPTENPGLAGGKLESFVLSVGPAWFTKTISGFSVPIPVCTVHYTGVSGLTPAVVRVRNVVAGSFDIKLQNPGDGSTPITLPVHCIVVEEGFWLMPSGQPIEARKYQSTVTDRRSSWVGEVQGDPSSFTSPVVLGQVLTANDSAWSVFWSRGSSRNAPPTSTNLFTGKHVGEDPLTTRLDEMVGFIIMQAFTDTLSGYEAGITSDTIRGYGNAFGGYTYAYTSAFPAAPAVVIASQVAMDGNDGGWAVATDSQTNANIRLNIDEDQLAGSERRHTTEEVAYVAFSVAESIELSTP